MGRGLECQHSEGFSSTSTLCGMVLYMAADCGCAVGANMIAAQLRGASAPRITVHADAIAATAAVAAAGFYLQATSLAPLEGLRMCEEYLQWCEKHPTHLRMVRGHVHKLITVSGCWSAPDDSWCGACILRGWLLAGSKQICRPQPGPSCTSVICVCVLCCCCCCCLFDITTRWEGLTGWPRTQQPRLPGARG